MQARFHLQRGAALIEFAFVGPAITLLGLASLQYGLLFFDKNHINYAAFMAARAGSMQNANVGKILDAYARALVPMYRKGTDSIALGEAYAQASLDVAQNVRIELLNPTKESFDDWNDADLQATVGGGKRVIPNGGLAYRDQARIGAHSGQSIQDANLIKIRITHGIEPKVPLMKLVYSKYLAWLDPHNDAFRTQLIKNELVPVVTQATLEMQSDAIEPSSPVSSPGKGNEGKPTDPGSPPVATDPPPECATIACTVPPTPLDPGGAVGGGTHCP